MKNIRLWTLGNLEKNIYPTKEAVQKLADILLKNGQDEIDIIWGPDLSVQLITEKEIIKAKELDPDNQKVKDILKQLESATVVDVINAIKDE